MKNNESQKWQHYVLGLAFMTGAFAAYFNIKDAAFLANYSELIETPIVIALSIACGYITVLFAYCSINILCVSGKEFDATFTSIFNYVKIQKTGPLSLTILVTSLLATAMLYLFNVI